MQIINRLKFPRFSTLAEPVGDIFIWNNNKPSKLKLPEKARRISLGQNHTAVIGQSGNLYTYGQNKYGQLGHNNKNELKQPKIVEYFEAKDIKVKDAICGQHHTIVLGQNGRVYTFGYGGKKVNPLMKLFVNYAGALGHGTQDSYSKPKVVKSLEEQNIKRITAGSKFNIVINDKGQVFHWGNGEYGVFGDGDNKNHNSPFRNEYFKYLEEEESISMKKVKSCSTFSIALMTDNHLYGWGSNHAGQMGIKNQIGIELHEMVNYPAAMIRQGFQDQNVANFDISENVTIFELQNKQFWWSGSHRAYKPQRIGIEDQNINLFAAGYKSFCLISEQNNIYSSGDFIKAKGGDEDLKTGIVKYNGSQVFGGKIIGIGGQYNSRYALIQ